jgi:hypothetical protein
VVKPLPAGPWEVLFQRAMRLADDIQRHGGLADPFWTFGGGTVLMFRYGHRLSKDIDIFVPDPQYLGYVTPRLSDTAASLTEEYTEMPGSFVKLQFEEGEVDFVAAPNLTDAAWERWEIQGRPVRVETDAEVIAKKMYHRGDRATARVCSTSPWWLSESRARWRQPRLSSCGTETAGTPASAAGG